MTNDNESQIVHAYGGEHNSISYNDALCMALDALDLDAKINLARVSDDAFELLSFDDNYRMDSAYVTLDVGRRLYGDAYVGVFVQFYAPDGEPKTQSEFDALGHEQIYGEYS